MSAAAPRGAAKRPRADDDAQQGTSAKTRAIAADTSARDDASDAFAAPDTLPAAELVDALRVAPPNAQLQWHVTLVDDKNSLLNAMKRVDDVMNAMGKPTATVRLTLTDFGLSLNADVQQCIMLAVRHTAHAVYTAPHDTAPASGAGRPERVHSVVVNVREFLTALRRHEADVVEVYRAAGRNDVVVTSRDENTGGVNWQLVPALEDDGVGCMLDDDEEIVVPIVHHMHINAGSLKSLLDAARAADATTVTLQVHTPNTAAARPSGVADTLLTTTFTTCHSASTAGGYCVPLRAVASTAGGTAETLMRWGILTLRDAAGVSTLTDAAIASPEASKAFAPPSTDTQPAAILTLDGAGAQVHGGALPLLSLEMSFGFQKLYKLLPTSGSVHLRFSENNLVVAYPSPHTQMMCIMAANVSE